jgi:hypothetical protein
VTKITPVKESLENHLMDKDRESAIKEETLFLVTVLRTPYGTCIINQDQEVNYFLAIFSLLINTSRIFINNCETSGYIIWL